MLKMVSLRARYTLDCTSSSISEVHENKSMVEYPKVDGVYSLVSSVKRGGSDSRQSRGVGMGRFKI